MASSKVGHWHGLSSMHAFAGCQKYITTQLFFSSTLNTFL
jgi:mediator of RNA polymerase II transcription subunit 12